jgi:hypothetical protein
MDTPPLADPCERPAASRPPAAARVLVTEWSRTWHADSPQPLAPRVMDLGEPRHRSHLLMMLGNAEFDDVCFEGETAGALAVIEGALTGTGGAALVNPVLAAASRLYRPGYRVFAQAGAGRFFVNAVPRPELFLAGALRAYADEFRLP